MKARNFFYLSFSLVASICIGVAVATPSARGTRPLSCGTYQPTRAEAQRIEYQFARERNGKGSLQSFAPESPHRLRGGLSADAAGGPATIKVYFHVITRADGVTGNITDDQIKTQMEVMNKLFAGKDSLPAGVTPLGPAADMPYRFVLGGVDRTANDSWFTANFITAYADEVNMKNTLRKGGAGDLNVYTNSIAPVGLGGYATFPNWYKSDPKYDGVVLEYTTMPGFGMEGKILVHEAGHWIGLYHTFQGGCEKYNDFVNDTPAERGPFGFGDWFTNLPDTCTGKSFPGKDPADNYMDYTAERAWYRFTAGQAARAKAYTKFYRGI